MAFLDIPNMNLHRRTLVKLWLSYGYPTFLDDEDDQGAQLSY